MPNRLDSLEVSQVDLVGRAANRRRWLLLKEDGLPQEILDELLAGEAAPDPDRETVPEPPAEAEKAEFSDKPWADVDKSKLPKECFLWAEGDKKEDWHLPYREGAGEVGEDGMYASAGPINKGAVRAIQSALAGGRTGEPMQVPDAVRDKAKRLMEQIGGDAEKGDEGGDSDMADSEELKKAQSELEALRKASADKDALLKAAEDAKAEALKKAADAEALVKAQKRTARGKELEPLCKSAQIETARLLDLEERDPETAKYLIEKLDGLVKQVDGLLGKEEGTARHNEEGDDFTARVKQEMAKNDKLTWKQAGEIVAKSDPALVNKYLEGKP